MSALGVGWENGSPSVTECPFLPGRVEDMLVGSRGLNAFMEAYRCNISERLRGGYYVPDTVRST